MAERLGLEVFNPRLRLERATQRGVMRVLEPLFPCYIFVHCALERVYDDLKHTPGVSSIVHFGMKIPAVPDNVIAELKQHFDSDLPFVAEDGVVPGAEVKIADGVFMGLTGMVLRSASAGQRIQVLLDFLGRVTLTEVDRSSLRVENRRMADILPALAATSASAPRPPGKSGAGT